MSDVLQPLPSGQDQDNPWFSLATLYGEPDNDASPDLARRNRVIWNRWMASALTPQQRKELVGKGAAEAELTPLTDDEKAILRSDFERRRSPLGLGAIQVPDAAEPVNFVHTQFRRRASFAGFVFGRMADFSAASLPEGSDFVSARFLEGANFKGAQFGRMADFRSVAFSEMADFTRARCQGANFRSAVFDDALFESADIRGATFQFAIFSGSALFHKVEFTGADFRSARFSGIADFYHAIFHDFANFRDAVFSRSADFISVHFKNRASFRSTTFVGADFTNAVFSANAIFAGAHFQRFVPDFRGSKMHEATEWDGVTWPDPPMEKSGAQAQVYRYERLKQEMERLKKHQDEQFFFGKEMRARRGLAFIGSGSWLLNYTYWLFSDYGQSILRPLLGLLGVFVIGAGILWQYGVMRGMHMKMPAAIGLSFANIFSFLSIKREMMAPEFLQTLSRTGHLVSVMQSLLGVLLLFLIGLALRNKLRMR
jgi:uncharacterized protein YjbI with pentapeptide repeats